MFKGKDSKKKQEKAPSKIEAIQVLRQAVTQIEQREAHLEKQIQICLNNSKAKAKRRDKFGSEYELKKKEQIEEQLQSVQEKRMDLETQIMALEDSYLNEQTLKACHISIKVSYLYKNSIEFNINR